MITSQGWLFLNKFPKEAEKYEKYVTKITKEKVQLAKSKMKDIDYEILQLVQKLKIVTSSQIAKLLFYKDKNQKFAQIYCNNHLKKLYELGCIDRFFPITENGKGSEPAHIVLGPVGAKILNIKGFRRIKTVNKNWRHTVMINEVFANFFLKYQIICWKKEVKMKWEDHATRQKQQQADVLMGYIYNEKEKYALLEIDMGTESIKTLMNKVKNYNEYFQTSYFMKDSWQPYLKDNIAIIPQIWFVMRYEKDANHLKNKLQKINSNIEFKVLTLDDIKK